MGDLLYDDFDVDALLDAQDSDEDGSDLPELERSLDDILNDLEFADALGDVAYQKSSSAPVKPDVTKNGDLSEYEGSVDAVGPEEDGNEISVNGVGNPAKRFSNPGIADDVSPATYQEDGRTEDNNLIFNSVHLFSEKSSSTVQGYTSDRISETSDRSEAVVEGIEMRETKRSVGNHHGVLEGNGTFSPDSLAVSSIFPQIGKRNSVSRPGDAFAAAAALSRQSGSRFIKSSYPLPKSSSAGDLETGNTGPETDFNPSLEDPPSQVFDNAIATLESLNTTLGYEEGDEDSQFSGGGITHDWSLDSGDKEVPSNKENGIRWDNDEILKGVIADVGEQVEMLSTLLGKSNEEPKANEEPGYTSPSDDSELSVKEEDTESVSRHSSNAIVPEEPSFDSAPDVNDGRSAPEILPDDNPESAVDISHMSERTIETEPEPEPEVSDVSSLNSWNEEMQVHVITKPDSPSNVQPQWARSLSPGRNSPRRHSVQPPIREMADNEAPVSVEENSAEEIIEEKPQPTALQIAEELETNAASSGMHWEEGAVAQPMRLEGIRRGAPAIGLLQLDALLSSALQREHGTPQALAVHSNFIAVGLSKGGILVVPSKYSATRIADETDAKHFVLATPGPDKSVSSMCFNQQGDLLLVGYSNGHLVLWDVLKANMIKTVDKEHSVPIVHTLFLGQDNPGARNFKAITSDSKGLTLLHTFTVIPVPMLRRYTVNTTCIMDGQVTGIVLSVSPLLPEEGSQVLGGSAAAPHGGSSVPMNLSSVKGVVGGATGSDVGRKFLYDGAPSFEDIGGGLVVFVTYQVVLVVRLLPTVKYFDRQPRPEGIREGAIPYTAWRRTKTKAGIPTGSSTGVVLANAISSESMSGPMKRDDVRPSEMPQSQEGASADGMMAKVSGDESENCVSLAIAWDRKVFIYQLQKSELNSVAQWEVDSPVIGVAWLEEQMVVVATSKDQLCLFTNEGVEIERADLGTDHGGFGALIYHTQFMNLYGNLEKAYHNAMAVRGAALYLLGSNQLWRARLLPWKDRIKALEDAGDWMGAFHLAMEIYDGRSQGVTGLPKGLDGMREAIMPTLLALLSAYIDEAFAYLSLALGPSSSPPNMKIAPEPIQKQHELSQVQGSSASELDNRQDMVMEAREQYARVGGVAIEFCVHIHKTEVLFENVFSKFDAVGQRGAFLELLEPYLLKDMLCGLAPEVMQALVEHYGSRGWLNRVEQCVLHMDIGSLDFNQVVHLCRDHGLYSALIYLFTKGLDDFISPLEELLSAAQNSPNLKQAKAYGYKLLVYLKYCFNGLAFPPGNGTLSSSRLLSLRGELLGYLLHPTVTREDGVETNYQDFYPRLLYLLNLDTQACLSVLGAAFPENGPLGVGRRDWVYPLSNNKPERGDSGPHSQGFSVPPGEVVREGLSLAQKTIDAIIHILLTNHIAGHPSPMSESTPMPSEEEWPTDEDTGEMLEFVAHFAAGRYAVVSTAIMAHILEHLTSPSDKGDSGDDVSEKTKNVIKKEREDLMVALLRAVPRSDWDAERALQLAKNAGYWQVTALLHAQKGDYTAALDSYLKDSTRPQSPFTFISHMLSSESGLEGSNLSYFCEAVLSRLPELIQLDTMSTLLIVVKHFSSENERILRELNPHPKLLFSYLKAVMNIRSSSLDDSLVELEGNIASTQQSGEFGGSVPRNDDPSLFDSQVYLADLLQRSGLEFTDEMAETFFELLCQFEPDSVRKFLDRYDNCRLEYCLKLCQEYGITDAATFLLERVGDVGSALSLLLVDVQKSMQEMDQALLQLAITPVKMQKSIRNEFLDLREVVVVHSVLRDAVALCQRNTFRLEPQESELLWFRLLDRFVEPLHNLNQQMKSSSSRKQQAIKNEVNHHPDQEWGQNSIQWKAWENDRASKPLRKVLSQFIGDIVNGMMGYIPLPIIMNKILEEHRGHEFGDFKATILDMLSAYGYERAILGTAKQLIEDDAFQNIMALKRGCSHAFRPIDTTCAVCGRSLHELGPGDVKRTNTSLASSSSGSSVQNEDGETQPSSDFNQIGIRIFPCGHATHVTCVEVQTESNNRQSVGGAICPICCHVCKLVDLSRRRKNPSLVNSGGVDGPNGSSKQSDIISALKQGSVYRTTDQVSGHSRLQLLKQIENGADLQELGTPLKLNSAPAFTRNKRVVGSAHVRGNRRLSSASSSRKPRAR